MANTLGLDDDLDGVELVQDVEAAFGVALTNAEASALYTVGDIYGLLRDRVSSSEATGRCATAMAFYRLRRVFSDLNIDSRTIRPDTQVESLTPLAPKALLKQINFLSGLRVPQARLTWLGVTGGLSIFAGFVSVSAPNSRALLVAVAGVVYRSRGDIASPRPRQTPSDCQTFGGLSRKVAGLNFGEMAAEGGSLTMRAFWSALVRGSLGTQFLFQSQKSAPRPCCFKASSGRHSWRLSTKLPWP